MSQVIIIVLVASLMCFVGYLRTRHLVNGIEKGVEHDKKSDK